jgi:glycosyltransferase involved in cell wall biosynthesis
MRILHLIDSGGVYGAERVLLYLAREQRRQGHQAFIGSIGRPGTPEAAIETLARSWDLPVVPIRIPRLPTVAVMNSLLGTIRVLKADVVHSHGYRSNILLGPVPRRWRGPMLSTLHGRTGVRRFSAMRLYERLDHWALRRVDCVVAVSRNMLNLPALRRVASTKLRVIANGIPPREARMADLAASNATALPTPVTAFMHRRPTLVAIGRLSAEKAFGLLLDGFAQARAQSGSAHQLLIAGEGPERELLSSRISTLGLQENVYLAGYIEGAERLLQDAAGFVMSSLTEGLPLVVLEAMQWRVPILATSVGAIPELLGGGTRGHLVAPGDIAALAHGLRNMMLAPQAAADVEVALAHAAVSQHYTSARMAEEYFSAYGAIA